MLSYFNRYYGNRFAFASDFGRTAALTCFAAMLIAVLSLPACTTMKKDEIKEVSMIEAGQALFVAHDHATFALNSRKIGDILVEPSSNGYVVQMVEMVAPEDLSRAYIITVAADGKIVQVEQSDLEEPAYGDMLADLLKAVIDGRQAYEKALESLRGYEHFDKRGRLSVELKGSVYHVTFPLIDVRQDSLAPDYAYLVHVDARSRAIKKILVPS